MTLVRLLCIGSVELNAVTVCEEKPELKIQEIGRENQLRRLITNSREDNYKKQKSKKRNETKIFTEQCPLYTYNIVRFK
ncbi:uncharacterized protein LOC143240193 isoform X3 [Tachypleus tridentatus]|uniref:uncharacterized protein LOC143240193 isoform X3 n=1 Tax=Tachypleus tridentatus TaxID=6853 RepID=UPI003FD34393